MCAFIHESTSPNRKLNLKALVHRFGPQSKRNGIIQKVKRFCLLFAEKKKKCFELIRKTFYLWFFGVSDIISLGANGAIYPHEYLISTLSLVWFGILFQAFSILTPQNGLCRCSLISFGLDVFTIDNNNNNK